MQQLPLKPVWYIKCMWAALVATLMVLVAGNTRAQVIFGANQHIEYHVGNLPFVISVPHDGATEPATIPDRTCNNPTTARDIQTRSLALQISESFFEKTGCRPHIIFCNLRRSKLDCNRNLADAACGNAEAERAWQEFHHFIDSAQSLAHAATGRSFYIDLHGHTIQRLELGYLLTGSQLRLSDSLLNMPPYTNNSSVKDLVGSNVNSHTHAQLLRGEFALGTLLENAGYPSVPSMQTPFPEVGEPYFNGGYSTLVHASASSNGATANGVQIECNWTNVRNTAANRKSFSDSLTHALTVFMNYHHNMNSGSCTMLSVSQNLDKEVSVYPTHVPQRGTINITGKALNNVPFRISNLTGQLVAHGVVKANSITIKPLLPQGVYLVSVMPANGHFTFRVYVHD